MVDDSSSEKTRETLLSLYQQRNDIVIVSLSRSFSLDAAISAGLKTATGDYVITLDPSIKNPSSLLPSILEKPEEAYDVINRKNTGKKKDSAFLKTINKAYPVSNKAEGEEVFIKGDTYFRGL